MKRTLFVLIAIILSGILSANPMNDIDNWASGQTHPFAADDVVTFAAKICATGEAHDQLTGSAGATAHAHLRCPAVDSGSRTPRVALQIYK